MLVPTILLNPGQNETPRLLKRNATDREDAFDIGPGVGTDRRTVAFWVEVSEGDSPNEAYPVCKWPPFTG